MKKLIDRTVTRTGRTGQRHRGRARNPEHQLHTNLRLTRNKQPRTCLRLQVLSWDCDCHHGRGTGFSCCIRWKGCNCYSHYSKSSEKTQSSEVNRLIEMESKTFSWPKGGGGEDEMYETKQNKWNSRPTPNSVNNYFRMNGLNPLMKRLIESEQVKSKAQLYAVYKRCILNSQTYRLKDLKDTALPASTVRWKWLF